MNFITLPSGQYFSLFLGWSLYHSDTTEEQKEKDSIHDWRGNEFEKLNRVLRLETGTSFSYLFPPLPEVLVKIQNKQAYYC